MLNNNLDILTEDLAARLWKELARATQDRHHDWRTPVLATQVVAGSGPQARTVVLRQAECATWTLRVYTDARSPKCSELIAEPLAQFSFWSKRLNWQLRAAVSASVYTEGDLVNAAWDRMRQSRSAADYLSALPPGSIQSSQLPTQESSNDSLTRHHLAVLDFKVLAMDWLALGQDNHHRAKLTPAGLIEWLVP